MGRDDDTDPMGFQIVGLPTSAGWADEDAPSNNDGRATCYWCGLDTEEVHTGFSKIFNVCPVCEI